MFHIHALKEYLHVVIKPTKAHTYSVSCHILLSKYFNRFWHHHEGSFRGVLGIQSIY